VLFYLVNNNIFKIECNLLDGTLLSVMIQPELTGVIHCIIRKITFISKG